MLISLQVSLLTIDELGAVVLAVFNNEKLLARFSLADDRLTCSEFLLGHRFNEGLLVLPVKVLEKD